MDGFGLPIKPDWIPPTELLSMIGPSLEGKWYGLDIAELWIQSNLQNNVPTTEWGDVL